MSKPSSDHDFQGLGGGTTLPSTNRILRHNIANENIPRINPLSNHTKRQILRRENPAQSLVLVNDKNAIFAFGRHDLRCLCHGRMGSYRQRLAWSKGHDGAGGIAFLSGSIRLDKALFPQLILQFPPDGLHEI